jgi:hypothetical protein
VGVPRRGQLLATEGKDFFFEKKKQKTFATWLRASGNSEPIIKSFLVLFFKKEHSSLP